MIEPATPITLGAIAAAASAVTLALFGVDYYSLLYGFLGAVTALFHLKEEMGRVRAMVYVSISTLLGAAIGNAAVSYWHTDSRAWLIIGCIGGGLLAQTLAATVLKIGPRLIEAYIARRAPGSGEGK